MKIFTFILIFFPSIFFAQKKPFLDEAYVSVGLNAASNGRFGSQYGVTLGHNKNIIQIEHLRNKEFVWEAFGPVYIPNRIDFIRTYGVNYGRIIQASFTKIIPTIGITLNQDNYRQPKIDRTYIWGYNYLGEPLYKTVKEDNYKESTRLGIKISMELVLYGKTSGLTFKPYLNYYHSKRKDIGFSISVLLGKIKKETTPKTSYNPQD